MNESWVVYVDESGDEGFQFGKGSQDWFVLSGIITPKASDIETVKLVDHVRSHVLGRKDQEPLHFRKLKHEHRIPFLDEISRANLKAIVVLIHKPSIPDATQFHGRYSLYFYALFLLLEGVSQFCRAHAADSTQGDGSAKIFLSHRGGLKDEQVTTHLQSLRLRTESNDSLIDWTVVKDSQIVIHSTKLMGLQLADAVASGFFFGVQRNQYGFTEGRYATMLCPIVYKQAGQYEGYGLRFWPEEIAGDIKSQSHLSWLREFHQCNL